MTRAGSRQLLRRSRVHWVLGGMVVAAFVLLVHDAVFAHTSGSVHSNPLLHSTWVGGVPVAAGLLAGTVSAFIARREFALSVAPRLRYTNGYRRESRLGLATADERVWCVDVSNNGRGEAVVSAISYDVTLTDPPLSLTDVDFLEMLRAVESTGFRDEEDFVLDNWTVGTSIRNAEDRRLWELRDPALARISRLVAHMTYASDLGETFETHVCAIPDR